MVYQLGIKRMINCNSNNNNRKQKTFIRDFLLFIELELAIGKPVNLKLKATILNRTDVPGWILGCNPSTTMVFRSIND